MARSGVLASVALLPWLLACAVERAPGDPGRPDAAPVDAAPDPSPADASGDLPPDAPPDAPADAPGDLADPSPDAGPADASADPPGVPDAGPPDASGDLPFDAPDAGPADLPSDLPPETPWEPASPGGFRVVGRALVDDRGREVVMHGVNVNNAAKYAPDFLPPWHDAAAFRELADAGLDSVRLQTYWAALMPREGVIDGDYLEAFALRVQWAADAGLLVVVDMHQDVFGVGFGEDGAPRWACDEAHYAAYQPVQPWYLNYLDPHVRACYDRFYTDDALFGRFVQAWVAVARRLRDHPAVVGFDVLNEPNPGSHEASRFVRDLWQPRQEQVAAALLASAPDRVVFFQGATMLAYGVVDDFAATPLAQVAFAPHYYLPTVHDGTPYDSESMAEYVDLAFDAVADSAARLGDVPVWMGEWGGPVDAPGFDRYLEDLLSRMAGRRWSWAIYSDDVGGFGIRAPDRTFLPGVLRRLSHPAVRRLPGPLEASSLRFLPDGSQRYEATFRWRSPGAPLVAWTGPGGHALVTGQAPLQDEPRAATCLRPEGSPEGLWSCQAGDAPEGIPWRVVLDRPAPAR